MNRICFLSLALFTLTINTIFAQSDWERVPIFETGNSFSPYADVIGITADGTDLYAYSTERETAVSSDGSTWQENQGTNPNAIFTDLYAFNDGLYLFDRGIFPFHALVWYSDDQGVSWSLDTSGLETNMITPKFLSAAGKLWMYNNYDDSKTDDDLLCFDPSTGVWEKVIETGNSYDFVGVNDSLFVFEIAAASNGYQGKLMRSGDGGETWNEISFPSSSMAYWGMRSDNGKLYLLHSNPIGADQTLSVSSDYGNTWEDIDVTSALTAGVLTTSRFTTFEVKGDVIVLAQAQEEFSDTTLNIAISNDGGESFTNTTLVRTYSTAVTDIEIFQSDVFVIMEEELFVYRNSDVISGWADFSQNASNLQMYPNPVKDKLIVEDCDFEFLSVFSLTGNHIIDLANLSDGVFDVSKLNPGTYFVGIDGNYQILVKE